MANKRVGNVIYNNFDQYTGQPFNTKVLTHLPDGTEITDDVVKANPDKVFKNKPEHGGGYSVRISNNPNNTNVKQDTIDLAETQWLALYNVSCPERGDVNVDQSVAEYRDYVNIKGVLNVHELQERATVRDVSDRPSYGQRPLKAVKFNFRVVGWRQNYLIDEAYLHLSEPPQLIDNSAVRDLIRVVKVGRLNYQLQIRQDDAYSVVMPLIEYERTSPESTIDYVNEVSTIVSPNVVKNSYNYDKWVDNINWDNIFNKPDLSALAPLKYDDRGNIGLDEIEPLNTPASPRVGVYKQVDYNNTSTFNWGTLTTGEPDGITAETIEASTRKFLRFRLRPNQTTTPERSEISTISPITPIEGQENVRWFSGLLRLPKTMKVAEGNSFVIMQFLPEATPVGREPCVALFVRDGRLVLESRHNPMGTGGYLTGDGGINVRPTMRRRVFDLGALNLGSWDKIVVYAKFSWLGDGELKLWRNDKLVVDYTGPNTWYDPNKNTPFIKFGIYNPLWASSFDEGLDSSYDLQVDWCDPLLAGYQATYNDVDPLNIDKAPVKINIDANKILSGGVELAKIVAVPTSTTVDVNTLLSTQNVRVTASSTGIPVSDAGNLMVFRTSNSTIVQLFVSENTDRTYIRKRAGGVWSNWRRLILDQDFATTTSAGIVLQSTASPDTATYAAGATPTKAEFDALIDELRDLKAKLRTAGIVAT